MKILKHIITLLTLFMLTSSPAFADDVAIHTDANFQVIGMSPNGQWACGVFVDAGNNTYPFRWNLLSNRVEMLGSEIGTAWDVANDGTVSGEYPDTNVSPNHAPVTIPCYWRGQQRYAVQLPETGNITEGIAGGISPDGHFMTGALCNDGIYTSYIWHDGVLVSDLGTGNHNVASCVSPDGTQAAGWSMKYNRTACIWEAGKPSFLEDSDHSYGPFNYARNFSPDGTKLLYWGGWTLEGDDNYLYCIYDIATKQQHRVLAPGGISSQLEFDDISNNEMMVGADGDRGYVYQDGVGMYIDEFLASKGVDITRLCDDLYAGADFYVGQLPIFRIVAISEDERVLAMRYYNRQGEVSSMVLKLDQDFSTATPVDVRAQQLDGLKTVRLTWAAPAGATHISGYYIYRNGTLLNRAPLQKTVYYDTKAADGDNVYQIALATTNNSLNRAEPITLTVTEPPVPAPYDLFARQRGVNGAGVCWRSPLTAIAHRRYCDLEQIGATDFAVYDAVDMEVAVCFDKDEIAQYNDFAISEVSFMPLAHHQSWTLNLYTRSDEGTLQLLYTEPIEQELTLGQLNTIQLTTPVALPSGPLIVAIEVETDGIHTALIGAQAGVATAGYTDMLRLTSEPDYISAYQSSVESGISLVCLTWAIDLGLVCRQAGLTPNTSLNTQHLSADRQASTLQYNVYLDGTKHLTTTATDCQLGNLSDGNHTIAVEAEYTDGRTSLLVNREINIQATYPRVDEVEVEVEGSAITATWLAPTDNDLTNITYSNATTHARGIHGNEETNYAFMAAANYTPQMVRLYDGYRISAFRFYPMSDAIFTFYLYENGELVCEQEVDQPLQYNHWNTVPLDTELYIKDGASYSLVIDIFDPEPATNVLALDALPPFEMRSDLVSTDAGLTWLSLSVESSTVGSWMMGMQIENTDSQPLDIDGYDIYLDGKRSDLQTSTTYLATVAKTGTHSLRVNTHYHGVDGAVAGATVNFTTLPDAISPITPNLSADRQDSTYTLQGTLAPHGYRGLLITPHHRLINTGN